MGSSEVYVSERREYYDENIFRENKDVKQTANFLCLRQDRASGLHQVIKVLWRKATDKKRKRMANF